jgi:hypothetical protein
MRFKKRKTIHLYTSRVKSKPHCPQCNKLLDAATGISPHAYPTPDPGSFSVCAECGAFLVYTDDLQLRLATAGELRQIESDPQWAELFKFAAQASLTWRGRK